MTKVKMVEFNFECPFHYTEVYQMSEYTAGSDSMCAFLNADCYGLSKKKCPLKDNSILVQGKVP